MKARENIDNIDAVCRELGDVDGKAILDIGCGAGALCRALAKMDADVTGIDPSTNAIEQAIELGGGANYQVATLDDLDVLPRSFDVIIFCTSLHHIPHCADALQLALILVKTDGKIIVLEPQTDDPLYPVYRWLDDEKQVQLTAQKAIDDFISNEQVARSKTLYLNKKYRYTSLDHLIDDMIEVDEARSLSDEDRKAMAKAYDAAFSRTKTAITSTTGTGWMY